MEMLTPTKSELGSSKEREEVESSEKDRSCLTKMMTPPLAWNARAGVDAIRTKSRESRYPEKRKMS